MLFSGLMAAYRMSHNGPAMDDEGISPAIPERESQ